MSCTSWRMNEVDLRPRPAPLLEAILAANYLRKRAVRNQLKYPLENTLA